MRLPGEVADRAGHAQLGQEQRLQVQPRFGGALGGPRFAVPRLAHDFSALPLMLHRILHDAAVDPGQGDGSLDDLRLGKADVALVAERLQHVLERSPRPQRRGAVDAQPLRQLVGALEADAPDVGGQAIRVFAHQLHGPLAVGAVDARRPGRADAVRLQEQHDAAHRLLLAPAFPDPLDALRTDPLDLAQERRAFVDDRQRALAEGFDDLAGIVLADPLDQAGREVLLDPLGRVRRRGAELVGLELQAVVAVLHPGARRLDVFPGHGGGQIADHGDQVAAAVGLDAQHGKAGVGVVKGDALDQAAQRLAHRAIVTDGVRPTGGQQRTGKVLECPL